MLVASLTIMVAALGYGVAPGWFARTFLGVNDLNLNLAHILRAVMFLYAGLAAFWVVAAIRSQYQDGAILTVILCFGGLLVGRLLSFAIEGLSAPLLQFYAAVEFVFLPVGYWLLRHSEQNQ